jgi:tRNA(adenine34) deaminase
MEIYSDEYFMRLAINEAMNAQNADEIPIGAIIVHENKILGKGHNLTEKLKDVTAHAEILALTAASQALSSKYLPDCTLYVTVEPCPMCAAALHWAQIGAIVYGTSDEKRGYSNFNPNLLHPKTIVRNGILQNECKELIRNFFRSKRSEH